MRGEVGQIINVARQLATQSAGAERSHAIDRALAWGDRWRAVFLRLCRVLYYVLPNFSNFSVIDSRNVIQSAAYYRPIDPWGVAADDPPADLILITHAHSDHFEPDDIAKVTRPGTRFVARSLSISANEKSLRRRMSPFCRRHVP